MEVARSRDMAQPTGTRPITGDDIISELIRNVEAGAFKVRYTTLVPCTFNVYLHPDDFDQIRPITSFVRSEAKLALDEHLAALNKGSSLPSVTKWLGFGSSRQPEFKALNPQWTIEFHRDVEDRLRRGDIEVYSELGSSEQEDLGAGAKTTFITRRPVESTPAADADGATQSSVAQPRTDRQAHAYLRYTGPAGPMTFPITRDQTVIGRGGKAFWVDLKVEGPADVSREHCRIRRDSTSGQFAIKDLSQYGTSVNGEQIPSSLERSSTGEKVDRNIEVPLPAQCRIGLADVFFIEFEAIPSA
jgi:hypothetical protein